MFTGLNPIKIGLVVVFLSATSYLVHDYTKAKEREKAYSIQILEMQKKQTELVDSFEKLQQNQKILEDSVVELNEKNAEIQKKYLALADSISKLKGTKNPKEYEQEANKIYKELIKCATGC